MISQYGRSLIDGASRFLRFARDRARSPRWLALTAGIQMEIPRRYGGVFEGAGS